MNRTALALGALLALTAPASAENVTWRFIATEIISCAVPALCAPLPPGGVTLATLTVEKTSAGRATFRSAPVSVRDVDGRDRGGDFEFHMIGVAPVNRTQPPNGEPQRPSLFVAQDFSITWVSVGGLALGFDGDIDGTLYNAKFSGARVDLASDLTLGPCANTPCSISGSWQN